MMLLLDYPLRGCTKSLHPNNNSRSVGMTNRPYVIILCCYYYMYVSLLSPTFHCYVINTPADRTHTYVDASSAVGYWPCIARASY